MCLEVPKAVQQPSIIDAGFLVDFYDWDVLLFQSPSRCQLLSRLQLCSGPLPCALSISSAQTQGGVLNVSGEGSIACLDSSGCSFLSISGLQLDCASRLAPAPYPLFEVEGALLRLCNTTVKGSWSFVDGGGVKAYAGATIQVKLAPGQVSVCVVAE